MSRELKDVPAEGELHPFTRSPTHPLTLPHIPRATYRVQFHAGFTLADATRLVDYLRDLGVSDLYASPILTARAGSAHGYDITNHNQLNPDVGGDEAFAELSAALTAGGLGLLLDIVPNHMGIGDQRNAWWVDVLENGPSSIYAPYFDIDWDPVPPELRDRVLLPVLGDQYGNVLERGELRLRYEGGAFFLSYYENSFPINPRSYGDLLSHGLDELIARLGPEALDLAEFQSVITALKYLPLRNETEPERVAERNREKEVVKRRLDQLTQSSEPIRAAIEATLEQYNGRPGDPRSFDLLDALMEKQPYRLAFWRVAGEEINYRRFFDINDLAAIRVELPEVLQATHQLILRLLTEGQATGLRIDHPDGLWDPASYFRQLQEHYAQFQITGPPWPLYVVAEKILAHGEALPADWAVAGTTGYDFLNEINGALIDRDNRRILDRLYADVTGPQPVYANLVNAKKKEIMLVSLASEVNTLSHLLDRLSERNRHYRDFTLNSLTFAIREVIACLPVYRTYITGLESVTQRDMGFIEAAVREARRRNPRTASEIFDYLRDTLLLRNLESFAEEARPEVIRFVMKFQQLSGPVMAKAVEDTTFYVFNRLTSLNEVGGHPELFGANVEDLHQHAIARRRDWPHSMLTSSTHDTKRSEDVRARINVLSELPREWRQLVGLWSRINARKKSGRDEEPIPSRNDEYLLYQTLVGIWPDEQAESLIPDPSFIDRVARYMEKATREAKVHTSWISPNETYDTAVGKFVRGILDLRRSGRFLESLDAFARRVAFFGRFNSLTQTLVKLTTPGVPDIYQGCELWDLSLVDPDNRRPVDYERRATLLAELHERVAEGNLAGLAGELLEQATDGRIKLYLTMRALELRREQPALFTEGDYLPLTATGVAAAHVIAFARRLDEAEAISVAPRLTARLASNEQRPPLGELWGDTWLAMPHAAPGDRYTNLFTGESLTLGAQDGTAGLPMRGLLAIFPVALLVRG